MPSIITLTPRYGRDYKSRVEVDAWWLEVFLSVLSPDRCSTPVRRESKVRTLHGVGYWFATKYRAAALERGHHAVAAQLRKQGVPLEVALVILFGRTA